MSNDYFLLLVILGVVSMYLLAALVMYTGMVLMDARHWHSKGCSWTTSIKLSMKESK